MARLGRSQPIRTHVPKAVVAPGGPVKIVGQRGTKVTVAVRDARTRRPPTFYTSFQLADPIVAPGGPVKIVGQRGTKVTQASWRASIAARRRVILRPHLAQPLRALAPVSGTAAVTTLDDVAAAAGNETFLSTAAIFTLDDVAAPAVNATSTAAIFTLDDVAAAAGNETFLSTAAIFTLEDYTTLADATVAVGSIAATVTFPTLRLQALRTSGWTRLRIQTDVRLPDVKHRDRNESF